jgi:hypothetical protein
VGPPWRWLYYVFMCSYVTWVRCYVITSWYHYCRYNIGTWWHDMGVCIYGNIMLCMLCASPFPGTYPKAGAAAPSGSSTSPSRSSAAGGGAPRQRRGGGEGSMALHVGVAQFSKRISMS